MNTSLPKVSILIPTYNQAVLLGRAIESALDQNYPNLEVIVSDDASSDFTESIIQEYLSRLEFRYFKHSHNVGRVANYAYMVQFLARGDWALILDGDDFLTDQTYISSAISLVMQNERAIFIQAGQLNRHETGTLKKLPDIENEVGIISGRSYFLNFYKNYYFSHLSTLFNLSLARQLGVPLYHDNIISSDVSGFLKLALHGNVVLYKKVVGEWTGHNVNTTKVSTVLERRNNIETMIMSCSEYASQHGPISSNEIEVWKNRMREELFFLHLLPYFCSRQIGNVSVIVMQALRLPVSRVFSFRLLKGFVEAIWNCIILKITRKDVH